MTEVEFLGARLEKDIIEMVEKTAQEEHVDKTKALKELILLGRKQFLLERALENYRKGLCSLDKASRVAGIAVHEMMSEAVKAGIKSSQTVEEYRRGLKLLE